MTQKLVAFQHNSITAPTAKFLMSHRLFLNNTENYKTRFDRKHCQSTVFCVVNMAVFKCPVKRTFILHQLLVVEELAQTSKFSISFRHPSVMQECQKRTHGVARRPNNPGVILSMRESREGRLNDFEQ